jgi:hypothetical protein
MFYGGEMSTEEEIGLFYEIFQDCKGIKSDKVQRQHRDLLDQSSFAKASILYIVQY